MVYVFLISYFILFDPTSHPLPFSVDTKYPFFQQEGWKRSGYCEMLPRHVCVRLVHVWEHTHTHTPRLKGHISTPQHSLRLCVDTQADTQHLTSEPNTRGREMFV